MAITTRSGKGAPLTHSELDTNFSELDTRVNTLETATIEKADITDFDDADYAAASHTHTASEITDFEEEVKAVYSDNSAPAEFTRERTGTQYGNVTHHGTDYTDTGITVGQSVWQEYRITATDESDGWTGATGTVISEVTDADNWKAKYVIKAASQAAGVASNDEIIEVSQDAVVIDNSSKVDINTVAVYLPNIPTSDPLSAGQLWNDAGTLKVSAG